MAEGFARKILGSKFNVLSAGIASSYINPYAVKVMNEAGIDISPQYSKSVMDFLSIPFEYVITVCDQAKEMCPNFTGEVTHRLHCGFEDPAIAQGTEEEILNKFREVRDLIKEKINEFFDNLTSQ